MSREIAQYFMNSFEFQVDLASGGQEALARIKNDPVDLLILDWSMPEIHGRDTMIIADQILSEKLKGRGPEKGFQKMKVIIYTSTDFEELSLPLVKHLQIIGYINKSWFLDSQKKKFRTLVKSINSGVQQTVA